MTLGGLGQIVGLRFLIGVFEAGFYPGPAVLRALRTKADLL